MLKTFAIAALSLTGALMMASPASAECPQRCDNGGRGHARGGALIDIDANVGGRGRGGLLNVDANVGGRGGLVDVDANVLGNNRGRSLIDVDANVGGRRGLLDVDANVGSRGNRRGSAVSLDVNAMQGGVGH